jgi:hypothetical protein
MRCQLWRIAAILVACCFASHAQAAVLLYRQIFNPPPPPQSGTILPWSVNMIGGFLGTYDGSFDPGGMRDAGSGQPIGGNDLPGGTNPGTAVFTGIGDSVGGPGITNNLRLFYTVEGQADFTAIDPATCPDGVYLNVWTNTQAGGADDFGYFAVLAGGAGPRDPVAWYVSSTPMATPTVDQGPTMNLRSLLYDPAAGNWNNMTVDPTNTVAPTVGGPAGSLAGLLIKGVGVLTSVTNPAPLPDFSNPTAFSSWNYADYRITCGAIPEPSTVLMLFLAAPAWISICRRQK